MIRFERHRRLNLVASTVFMYERGPVLFPIGRGQQLRREYQKRAGLRASRDTQGSCSRSGEVLHVKNRAPFDLDTLCKLEGRF
jgi:hypothetical protein